MSKRDTGAANWPYREAVFEQTRAGCSEMAFEIVLVCLCVFVFLSSRDRGAAKWPSREAVFEQALQGCSEMAFQKVCFVLLCVCVFVCVSKRDTGCREMALQRGCV